MTGFIDVMDSIEGNFLLSSFYVDVDSKGRIVIPSEARQSWNIEKGDTLQLVLNPLKPEAVVRSLKNYKEPDKTITGDDLDVF